jgi:hypothetical protein
MTHVHTMRRIAAAGLVLCLVIATGCSSEAKRYRVFGKVTYKGEPVKAGSISFGSDDPKASSASGAITDGKYDIASASGLTPGKYKVIVTYPDPKAPKPREDQMPGDVVAARELLPEKYNAKTELSADIKAQDNEVNYELK